MYFTRGLGRGLSYHAPGAAAIQLPPRKLFKELPSASQYHPLSRRDDDIYHYINTIDFVERAPTPRASRHLLVEHAAIIGHSH